jgi:hypothetical protein
MADGTMSSNNVVIPKLMTLEKWRHERFETPPSKSTALRYAQNGDIPAKKIGGQWFVMLDEEINTTGSDRVDAILKEIH